ncbi:DsrE family protein [Bradyrhizobium japonicum]|uniref:DsrE family protein n=1 Tax=Bradyrhizobium japonicum TaxID=375 RepID=UPI001BA8031C|nr:DsrE family protein [Bradyrhizobium japonicum]MBR0956642.1 DsrE family protein [Bradyrhizobium japonicum]
MLRRSMLRASLAGLFGTLAVREAVAATETSTRQRVVYHLADADRVVFVLGNLQNHVDGVGGPGKADIRLVVHGPALRTFHALVAEDHTVAMMKKLTDAGVGFDACANTMKAQGVKLDDLTPGFVVAEKGGVVRLAELEQQGYAYLRP